jgi:hypothetical protein
LPCRAVAISSRRGRGSQSLWFWFYGRFTRHADAPFDVEGVEIDEATFVTVAAAHGDNSTPNWPRRIGSEQNA